MNKRSSLLVKLLVLVSLPLFVEVAFVVLLSVLQLQAEEDIRRYQTSREIISQTWKVGQSVFGACSAGFWCLANKNSVYVDNYWKVRRETTPIIEEFKTTVSTEEPELRKCALDLANRANVVLRMFDANLDAEEVNWADVRLLQRQWAQLAKDQVFIIKGQLKKYPESVETKWRTKITNSLYLGLVISVVVTFALMIVLYRNIIDRIGVMVQNTNRVYQKQPLLEKVKGNDEIARLDEFFHGMSDKLVESDKFRKSFLSMVTHDLRAPLTNLGFFLDMVREGLYDDNLDSLKYRVENLGPELERINRLLDGLLQIDKAESGHLELQLTDIDVHAMIDNSINSIIELAHGKEIDVTVEIHEAARIRGDVDRLSQVLINLLGNAIKFTPAGGAINIRASQSDGSCSISVSDTGPGIPRDQMDCIFKLYHQSKAEHAKSGFGLGLTICKSLVEQHGGRIGVTANKSGPGTTFWFSIPSV